MFGYRHSFHAGNFADAVKHSILTALLSAMKRKDKPLFVLDTHAGTGRYDLHGHEAQKTAEYHDGIQRLLEQPGQAPTAISTYLDVVGSLNPEGGLRWYPGSPRLTRALLRTNDRLVVTELNRPDYARLKQEFEGDRQVAVHRLDAYQGLKAFLPPAERRGLVLIDPPYERKDEYERVVTGLETAYARWPTGVYALWYPILDPGPVRRFHAAIRETGIRKILLTELSVRTPERRDRLNGTGMLIVNPPWQLDEAIRAIQAWLLERLMQETSASTRTEWLVPET